MTTPNPAKGAATKPAAKATKPATFLAVAEGKIDHTACYEAKLHAATPAGRSLCRTVRAEGKPLTKKSFTAAAVKKAEPKKAASRKPSATSSEDAMVNLSTAQPAPAADDEGDDPYDEADATA